MTHSDRLSLLDGGHLNVRIDGAEGAPWVVMSNSVLTDLSIWDAQIAPLTKRFRVLRYDQRGHGGSSLPEEPMNFADYGNDLHLLLEDQGIKRCTFVGLSMGVPTGLAALAKAPERFAAFVAVDGVAKSAPGREAFWAERRETARDKGMIEIAKTTVLRWLPGATDAMITSLQDMVAQTPVAGFAAATSALASYDHVEALRHLDGPFLGIAGAEDGAMPDAIKRQFGDLNDARFANISDAGHLPNFQQADAFNDVLLTFLSDNSDITEAR